MARTEDASDGAGAIACAGRDTVMTLHTPVPAGNERYDPALAEEIIGPMAAALDIDGPALRQLGRGPTTACKTTSTSPPLACGTRRYCSPEPPPRAHRHRDLA